LDARGGEGASSSSRDAKVAGLETVASLALLLGSSKSGTTTALRCGNLDAVDAVGHGVGVPEVDVLRGSRASTG